MKRRSLKHLICWFFFGAIFGIGFGLISSIFQGGPSPWLGVRQSWWWFASAGLIKALTDLRLRSLDEPTAEKSKEEPLAVSTE